MSHFTLNTGLFGCLTRFETNMMLHCRIEIDHLSQHCWFLFIITAQSITNPTADDIQDSMQRVWSNVWHILG